MNRGKATKRESAAEKVWPRSVAMLFLAVASSSLAATAPQGAIEVKLDSSVPAGHFLEFLRFDVPYGPGPNDLGFAPGGIDRQALGPVAFDVAADGKLLVVDPVRQQIFGIDSETRALSPPVATWSGTLSEIAIDLQGVLWGLDARRGLVQPLLPRGEPLVVDRTASADGFIRSGRQIFLRLSSQDSWLPVGPSLATPGKRPVSSPIQAIKAGAESALLSFDPSGGSASALRFLIQTRKPLACVQVLGVDSTNRAFFLVELFERLGSLEVERLVLALEASGRIKAVMPITGNSAVPLNREFVLAPDGALYRMLPGEEAVRFYGWKVSP